MFPEIAGIQTYILIYTAGILLHGGTLVWVARRMGSSRWVGVRLGMLYLFAMYPGARLLAEFVFQRFNADLFFTAEYWTNPDCWALWGGPLFYLAVAVPVEYWVATDKAGRLDLIAWPLPVAMFVAKLACFANGCCHGSKTDVPWAITFPYGSDSPVGVPLHPTQLYEAVVLLVVVVVHRLLDGERWRGTLLFWFVGFYGVGRCVAEFFRAEGELRRLIGPMSASQWVCLAAGLTCFCVVAVAGRSSARPAKAQS